MQKRILSYSEYASGKKPAGVNEGFLDSILNFFKGIFDLFSDKKVKEDSTKIASYMNSVSDDEEIGDDELSDEIDIKRVRKSAETISTDIKKRIDIDSEREIVTYRDLTKTLTSFIAMILIQQESLKMKFIQKMVKNTDLQKRFVWVPEEFRTKPMDFLKQAVPNKNLLNQLYTIAETEPAKQKAMIEKFSTDFIDSLAESFEMSINDYKKKVKSNDKELLNNILDGMAAMANNIVSGMQNLLKNTPDDKVAEMIADEMVQERTRKRKAGGMKAKTPSDEKALSKDKEEGEESASRMRKKSAETAEPVAA